MHVGNNIAAADFDAIADYNRQVAGPDAAGQIGSDYDNRAILDLMNQTLESGLRQRRFLLADFWLLVFDAIYGIIA